MGRVEDFTSFKASHTFACNFLIHFKAFIYSVFDINVILLKSSNMKLLKTVFIAVSKLFLVFSFKF